MEGRPARKQRGELEPHWLRLGALAVVGYLAFELLNLLAAVLHHFMAGGLAQ